ncbi:beta-trefoil DNA-binding domain-containing protein [Blakeslea trispora]|nr:beta-trefoil DNA-binding domain-containing protein [Blakeslea trispora]
MTSKVAQKSLTNQTRFLCPPPTAMVIGSSWWTPSEQQKKGVQFRDENHPHGGPPTMTICISGENSEKQSGRIEWYDELGTVIAMEDWFQNERQTSLAGGRCVLKRLYISDTDEKKKKVECLIKLQLANGHLLGTLSSRAIKVISKPSKKRQSVKNVELCIYHGTLVSLFNRIRSQTVSTKYLGVSSTLGESCADTCFVARTGAWDPFIIWIVGPPPSTTTTETTSTVNDYIGCASLSPNIPYPNPPTIALKNKTHQPLAVRYNQHVVLQCLTTGLVSPVMIIRKVDKASTVVGGARCPEGFDVSFSRGGEMGDEVLGDPVSQLHKVALQIVQPETSSYHPSSLEDPYQMMPQTAQSQATYLACLNDMVGTRKTANKRSPIKSNQFLLNSAATRAAAAAATVTAALPHSSTITDNGYAPMTSDPLSRQRRASLLFENASSMGSPLDTHTNARRRISTLAEYGAYWSEDVTDAAVWTIVGTECAIYTFWTPPQMVSQEMNDNIRFPYITHMSITQDTNKEASWMMTLSGEYFSRDLQVWLGDIKATYTEYKSRDMLVCGLPSREELL